MPTAPVSSATTLIRFSSAFGISSRVTMPTMGMNTASVRAQLSNQSIGTIPLGSGIGEQQEEAQEPHCTEQQQCVTLDTTGLQVAQEAAALAGDLGDTVDGAVDPTLVQLLVGEFADDPGTAPGTVDDRVDHVLV